MNAILVAKIISIFAICVKYVSSDDSNDKCSDEEYYKPYARVSLKVGDVPIKQLSSSGFLDVSGLNRVILCLNGPAFIYVGIELDTSGAYPDKPPPTAFTNGTLAIYEHSCFLINHILKKDVLAARAGKRKHINLFREVFGVYLIGNKEDYREPEFVQFNDNKFNHIITSSVPGTGHAFAMVGSLAGHAFCVDVTVQENGQDTKYTIKMELDPNKLTGPQISLRFGVKSLLDDVFKEGLTEFTLWKPCHHPSTNKHTTTPSSIVKNGTNLTSYDPFATYAHGTRIPNFHDPGTGSGSGSGSQTTESPVLSCDHKGLCYVTVSDTTRLLPDLVTSVKCDPANTKGLLTENKCYFWQYSADFYINLQSLELLQWRLNLFDEVRKIAELVCPMVHPDMVQLSYQIVFGYYTYIINEVTVANQEFVKRQHPEWVSELTDHLILCRSKAKAMNFNYSVEIDRDEEYVKNTQRRGIGKGSKTHWRKDKSSIFYDVNDLLHGPIRDVNEFEEASHIEDRKPPLLSDQYRLEMPKDIGLMINKTTVVPLFFYREGVELARELNYAIDVVWKAISIALGYCNKFYQAKKPRIFPELYNAFYQDFLQGIEEYWMSPADNVHIRYFMEEYMDSAPMNKWLDSCLEASYIISESPTYRAARPLIFIENIDDIPNYFLELPSDVPILSSSRTNPVDNKRRSLKRKRQLELKEQRKKKDSQNNEETSSINHQNSSPKQNINDVIKKDKSPVPPKSHARIMG